MKTKFFYQFDIIIILIIFYFICFNKYSILNADELPVIFPLPQEIEIFKGNFEINENTLILIPQKSSENDKLLARFLVRELSDKYNLAVNIQSVSDLPSDKNFILMGTINNPLINKYQESLNVNSKNTIHEGYVLQVDSKAVIIAGWDEQGSFYGLQSLRQLIMKDNGLKIPCVKIRDWPNMPFRGIRLYIPGKDNISFFKRFLRDFMALYKFNKVIIESNCMRLDKHPEVNAGWIEYAEYMNYTRQSELRGIHKQTRNSGHQDAGDSRIIEKEDLRDIVKFAEQNFIEVIPEIPSLTHSYYLLTRHPELAEYKDDVWPDTYCPSNPKTYELLFDVLDEYIEVINPKMIHIGHDEWWGAPMDVCPNCRGKDYSELFAQDINIIHNHLSEKGISVAMWGDHLLESVRGKGPREMTSPTGYKYKTPGGLNPTIVEKSIPKDVLIFNWFWNRQENDVALHKFGFKQLYGNFEPNINNWEKRIKEVNVIGGAPSSWATTNEFNFGKDLIYDFLGCANLLWSKHYLEPAKLSEIVRSLMPTVRSNLSGERIPSENGNLVVPLNITSYFNASSGKEMLGANLETLKIGKMTIGKRIFELANPSLNSGKCAIVVGAEGKEENPITNEVKGIPINEDVSSIIFLHSCSMPSGNQKAYFCIFNNFDSADILGWYEVVYEDNFKDIIPIQYGVNILEWNAYNKKNIIKKEVKKGPSYSSYCYGADAVDCSYNMQENPITFYAFEWTNKRFGKIIKEINLKGSIKYKGLKPNFSNVVTEVIPNNAIMLIGLSVVKKREIQEIK